MGGPSKKALHARGFGWGLAHLVKQELFTPTAGELIPSRPPTLNPTRQAPRLKSLNCPSLKRKPGTLKV